ncbi:MAG: carboxypeptidase-like regulatory domain-containing protein, partial [Prevotellaceae bacterium]|nr:carboxypeptidase-like regulatory domain-containing protein [Prevotellaceae bacterium]
MKKIIMKKIVWILLFVSSIAGSVYAQKIELKGTVREAKNNNVFASANIVLQTVDSAFVTGTTSSDEGKFAITNIAQGDYRLVISCLGYETQYIALEGLKNSIILPDILVEEEAIGLDAVTVSGSSMTNRIDRKLIFPTEQQINASGNGIDLLQQMMLPRLQINPLTRAVGVAGDGEV